LNKHLI